MVEAKHKRTGQPKTFTDEVWVMLEKSGHARRSWDFVRRYSVEVPAEVSAMVRVPTSLSANGVPISLEYEYKREATGHHMFTPQRAVFEDGASAYFNPLGGEKEGAKNGILDFATPKQQGKKRRSKPPKQI